MKAVLVKRQLIQEPNISIGLLLQCIDVTNTCQFNPYLHLSLKDNKAFACDPKRYIYILRNIVL